jgi:hypothetical protein
MRGALTQPAGWFVDELDPEEAVSDAIIFLGEVDAVESTSFTVQF